MDISRISRKFWWGEGFCPLLYIIYILIACDLGYILALTDCDFANIFITLSYCIRSAVPAKSECFCMKEIFEKIEFMNKAMCRVL